MEVLDSFSQLVELRGEWSSFAESCEGLTPFQLPDWLLPWWRQFGSGVLQVLVFRSAGALTGVIPCFRHEWNGQRQLTLMGSGISDYLEPAISPQYRAEILDGVSEYLELNQDWDLCDWQDLSADTPLKTLHSNKTLHAELNDETECTHIPVTRDFDDFMEQRPRGLRRNLRRYTEKALRMDKPEFSVTAIADDELMAALLRLHTSRWHRHGQSGMVVANRSGTFLGDVAAEFAHRDMLRFFSLRFQNKIAAVILAFAYRNELFGYLSAFDPELESLAFGTALLAKALRHASENGYKSWNFLRGNEPYKFLWGAESIPKCRVRITRS